MDPRDAELEPELELDVREDVREDVSEDEDEDISEDVSEEEEEEDECEDIIVDVDEILVRVCINGHAELQDPDPDRWRGTAREMLRRLRDTPCDMRTTTGELEAALACCRVTRALTYPHAHVVPVLDDVQRDVMIEIAFYLWIDLRWMVPRMQFDLTPRRR
jgi:hypothetical protein